MIKDEGVNNEIRKSLSQGRFAKIK